MFLNFVVLTRISVSKCYGRQPSKVCRRNVLFSATCWPNSKFIILVSRATHIEKWRNKMLLQWFCRYCTQTRFNISNRKAKRKGKHMCFQNINKTESRNFARQKKKQKKSFINITFRKSRNYLLVSIYNAEVFTELRRFFVSMSKQRAKLRSLQQEFLFSEFLVTSMTKSGKKSSC